MLKIRPSTPAYRRLAVTLGVLAVLAASATAAWALPPFGSGPKSSPAPAGPQAELYSYTIGCHPNFDRIVFRLRFGTPGYRVQSVNQVVHDGSGLPVTLAGNAKLLVVLRNARAHTLGGTFLVRQVATPLCPNLRQVKNAGDFEGVVSFGLGLKHAAPFRVFRLTNPTRVVVDIAH